MKKEKSTIRPSPTINRICYEVFEVYGIPLSNFIERESMKIVFDDEKLKNEVWHEIKLRENQVKFYKEEKRILDKKILKIEDEIEELKESMMESIRTEISNNLQKTQSKLMELVTIQREKFEESNEKGFRYDIKKITIDEVIRICNDNNVTPKMVLPLINQEVLKVYFDKKCGKYVK